MAEESLNPGQVTQLLQQWSDGETEVLEELLPLVYSELRKVAAGYLRKERGNHTLQPTALVHEAYLKLLGQDRTQWSNRAHFFAIAAQAMRRILVDHARKDKAAKRGGPFAAISLEDAPQIGRSRSIDLIALDFALERLAELDERQARIVELRFFGGLTVEEASEVMNVSERTVAREWKMARAWLRDQMEAAPP